MEKQQNSKEAKQVKVSLICVYNDRDQYHEMVNSARMQTLHVEMIGLDNRSEHWSSAARALDEGANRASGDLLVFLHQDLVLTNERFLENLAEMTGERPRAIYGVAGAIWNGPWRTRVVSSMREGSEGVSFKYNSLANSVAEVFSLDECLIAMHRNLLNEIQFDASTCKGWHLYAVDLCMQARLLGIPSYVVQSGVWHKSSGRKDAAFYSCERALAAKYRHQISAITTTCTKFPTGRIAYRIYSVFRRIRRRFTGLSR